MYCHDDHHACPEPLLLKHIFPRAALFSPSPLAKAAGGCLCSSEGLKATQGSQPLTRLSLLHAYSLQILLRALLFAAHSPIALL